MAGSFLAPDERSLTPAMRAARGLGWFSLALGAAELIAPGRIARALGMEGEENILRAYGVREIGAGVGALSDEPTPFVWARVAGDLVDLATLYLGPDDPDHEQQHNVRVAVGVVAGITLVDLAVAGLLSRERSRSNARDGSADFSDRSGFPGGVESARGAAEFATPRDYRAAPQGAGAAGVA